MRIFKYGLLLAVLPIIFLADIFFVSAQDNGVNFEFLISLENGQNVEQPVDPTTKINGRAQITNTANTDAVGLRFSLPLPKNIKLIPRTLLVNEEIIDGQTVVVSKDQLLSGESMYIDFQLEFDQTRLQLLREQQLGIWQMEPSEKQAALRNIEQNKNDPDYKYAYSVTADPLETIKAGLSTENMGVFAGSTHKLRIDIEKMDAVIAKNLNALSGIMPDLKDTTRYEEPLPEVSLPVASEVRIIQSIISDISAGNIALSVRPMDEDVKTAITNYSTGGQSFNIEVISLKGGSVSVSGLMQYDNNNGRLLFTGFASDPTTIISVFLNQNIYIFSCNENGDWTGDVDLNSLGIQPGEKLKVGIEVIVANEKVRSDQVEVGIFSVEQTYSGQFVVYFDGIVGNSDWQTVFKTLFRDIGKLINIYQSYLRIILFFGLLLIIVISYPYIARMSFVYLKENPHHHFVKLWNVWKKATQYFAYPSLIVGMLVSMLLVGSIPEYIMHWFLLITYFMVWLFITWTKYFLPADAS